MKPLNPIILIPVLIAISWALCSWGAPDAKARQSDLLHDSQTLDAARIHDFGNNTNFLLRPGLIADRTGRTVRISAESTALNPGEPVEFILITGDSGKDYESLAVSFTSAADIHAALEFIGLKSGRCVNPASLRFWPKGDRVRIKFHFRSPHYSHNARPEPNRRSAPPSPLIEVRAEDLVTDTRTGSPLPETGFVFTGSERLPTPGNGTGLVYSADVFSPGSIISIYNDPSTVVDVPRRASQQDVYAHQVPNPDMRLPPGILIEVVMEPFYRDAQPHRSDYTLAVTPGKGTGLDFSLEDMSGQVVNTNRTLNGLLATLGRLTGPDHDVFVVFHPDDALPLKAMPALAQMLSSVDTERGIRLESPPEGHPYFKAFIPNQTFRQRENHPPTAAELHLTSVGMTTTGSLVFVEASWTDQATKATSKETLIPTPSPIELEAALATREFPPHAMFVSAPPSLTYGELRRFVAPLLKRKMILYVFQER